MKKYKIALIAVSAALLGVLIFLFIHFDVWSKLDAWQKRFADETLAPFFDRLGIDIRPKGEEGENNGDEGNGDEGGNNDGGEGGEGEPELIALEAPSLAGAGPLFTWGAVENAYAYEITLNGNQSHLIYGTEFIWDGYDKGGVVAVKALGDGITYAKESNDSNKIILPTLGKGSAYAEFEVGNTDVYISSSVDKVRLYSTVGDTTDACIYIRERTSPLLIELDNVHCRFLGTEETAVSASSPLITVRVVGDSPSGFKGFIGSSGSVGVNGGGLAGSGGDGTDGGKGTDAGRLPNVIFIGSRSVAFIGGMGGSGGKGGDPAWYNSVAGRGGDGGDGGTGLVTAICRVALKDGATLDTYGGAGGERGLSGAHGGLDKPKYGDPGNKGADLIGIRTDYANIEYVKTVNYTMESTSLTVVGSIISWEAVEGAEYYEVTIGDKRITTEKTAINWKSYRNGGVISVAPFRTDENGDIHSSRPVKHTAKKYPEAGAVTEYVVGATTAFEDVTIPSTVNICRITMADVLPETEEELALCSVFIEKRDTPLHIILNGVLLKYLGNLSESLDPDATLDSLVTVETEEEDSAALGVVLDHVLFTGSKGFSVSTTESEVIEIVGGRFADLIVTRAYYLHVEGGSVKVHAENSLFTEDKRGAEIYDYETVE